MKREIKFRVWSCFQKHYLTDHGSVFLRDAGDVYNSNYIEESNLSTTVQMYTGIKDRNGKEIYEGDIVKFEGVTQSGREIIKVVVWDNEGARFMYDYSVDGCCGTPMMYISAPVEIIGNIFENRTLLASLADAQLFNNR